MEEVYPLYPLLPLFPSSISISISEDEIPPLPALPTLPITPPYPHHHSAGSSADDQPEDLLFSKLVIAIPDSLLDHDRKPPQRPGLSIIALKSLDGSSPTRNSTPRPNRYRNRPRSLILTPSRPMATLLQHQYSSDHSVMSSTEPSPGSPPELTNSKSSKSSSFHSSSLSDSASHDLAHFEDITLDDIHGEIYARRSMPEVVEKARPNSSQKLTTMPHNHRAISHPRDLTSKQHVLVSTRMQVEPHLGLALPPKRQRPRRPKAPNTLLTNLNPVSKRSRSVSPISPRSFATSPIAIRGSTSSIPQGRPEGLTHTRRQSWQPGRRKTVQELEDEYHDSDEDLPEDAVIWNVPISPRPPTEREKSRSPRQSWSAAPSPSPTDAAKGLGLDFSASSNPITVSKPLPKSPRLSSLPRSVSMTSIPEDYSLSPRSGTKSWDATLSDLSAEARMLTEILEERAEEREKEQERHVQSGSPAKPSPKRSVSASTIELPPMRKGELMIDPLPISKEKEKFLTRTRPSWLPPKDPEEEKRHLKEYQKMMAKALEAEKRKAKKQQQQQCERDDTKESLARVWQQHVLPNWEEKIREPQTKDLWWKGITPRDRGMVWQKAVGNALGLSDSSYRMALDRAKAAEARAAQESSQQEKETAWFVAIRHDVKEAFPELKIFQPGGPLHDTLVDVLMAYTMYRSDVGYVYGTHFIAALLILNLSGPTAFITLANILNRPIPSSFLNNTPAQSKTISLVLRTLEREIPALHAHLTNPQLDLDPATYLAPLFRSLFCGRAFGMDVASRVWDVYVFEGDEVLVKVAVALMKRVEGRLYGGREECLDVLLGSNAGGADLGREDEFMEVVRGVDVVGDGEMELGRR